MLCPDLSLTFIIKDKELLETPFNRFFNDELLDEVVQPLGLTATAHKPYNGPTKTRFYPKVLLMLDKI